METKKCGDCFHADVCEEADTLVGFSRENPAYCGMFLDNADVVEVVHGRWEHTHGGGYFKVTCTACGVAVMKGSTELFGIQTVGWAYCPRCGAKMDLKEAEHGR